MRMHVQNYYYLFYFDSGKVNIYIFFFLDRIAYYKVDLVISFIIIRLLLCNQSFTTIFFSQYFIIRNHTPISKREVYSEMTCLVYLYLQSKDTIVEIVDMFYVRVKDTSHEYSSLYLQWLVIVYLIKHV
jgi:hypothetical protein